MNDFQDFKSILKSYTQEIFNIPNLSIKKMEGNEIGILFNDEGFIIEKTKNENSIKVFLRKNNKQDLLLRSFMVVYGDEKEKEYFEKGYNKLYFETNLDIKGILIFLKNKYESAIQYYFMNDEMSEAIEKYFADKRRLQENKTYTLEETQKLVIESMAFSKRLRFSEIGEPYLLN